MKWQSKRQLTRLLSELVSIPSITGSKAEKEFPFRLAERLGTLDYYKLNPSELGVHPTGEGRFFLTALARGKPGVRETVVLLSHFDVVDTEDYGDRRELAFDPEALTEALRGARKLLPEEAAEDIGRGEWLFGRGTMDMKSGLVLHMSMLERAASGEFEGNLLLLTVPDEEVGSAGMRAAVPKLLELAHAHGLTYVAALNSEPTFPGNGGDRGNALYKGTIGKLLPGFLCFGKETHVGEPLAGLNANRMIAAVVEEMELNEAYSERIGPDATPPPTCLLLRSLKNDYSVQTPYRAAAMFNLFLLERTAEQALDLLKASARRAADAIERSYAERAAACAGLGGAAIPELRVKVYAFAELEAYAIAAYGQAKVDRLRTEALEVSGPAGERDTTIAVVDRLALLCRELGPMIVLFFSPPYYPAVSSRGDRLIERTAERLTSYAKATFGTSPRHENVYRGITDLSYVGSARPGGDAAALGGNMPMWERGYAIPYDELRRFAVPVLNVGPVGMDAHKWTERLDMHNAFVVTADLLRYCIRTLLETRKEPYGPERTFGE